jgi:hypothetical protein
MIDKIEHVADGFVRVYKTYNNNQRSMVLPTRQGNLEYWIDTGTLVQDVFPHFDADQREFLITGILPEEWDAMFGSEDM